MINAEIAEKGRELTNALTETIIRSALGVHSALGPGLLEGADEICLAHELRKHRLEVATQVALPVV